MKNIIFIAPPAAGKGTQSNLISEKYKIPHISVGALLRKEIANNTDIGIQIKDDIRKGMLINNDFIVDVLVDRLNEVDCQGGFILDGFPRNIDQLKYLEEILNKLKTKITHVIHIDVDKELAMKRTIGRLVCSGCSVNYNDQFEKTKAKYYNKCDYCASTLTRREDDKKEVFEVRYNTYLTETAPLLEYFNKQGILYKVNGNNDTLHIYQEIIGIID